MPNVVLLGGGHAMLPTLVQAGRWVQHGVAVTLVDAHRWLYYSGMVPEYLGGLYTQDEVRIDLERLCRQSGVTFLQSEATSIHPAERTVATHAGTLPYDVLAVDVGATNPHQPEGAIPTKPIYHVETLQKCLRSVLATSAASLNLVIVGAGAAGVEIALNVTSRFGGAGRSRDLHLSMVEAGDAVLPRFPQGMQNAVSTRLRRRGVDLHTRTQVASVDDETVHTDGPSLPADAVLWATGSVGPDLFSTRRLSTDDRGFLRVRRCLQSHDSPHIFAAGDCASLDGYETLEKVGVHAVKQGPVLRRNLDRTVQQLLLEGKPAPASDLVSFTPYPASPLILSTGTSTGFWTSGPVWWQGSAALRLKHWIDRRWIRAYNPLWSNRPASAYLAGNAP